MRELRTNTYLEFNDIETGHFLGAAKTSHFPEANDDYFFDGVYYIVIGTVVTVSNDATPHFGTTVVCWRQRDSSRPPSWSVDTIQGFSKFFRDESDPEPETPTDPSPPTREDSLRKLFG